MWKRDRLYERLGVRLSTVDGARGASFAVWAPNARRVSVVGSFNGWDGSAHPMTRSEQGVFERFVPGVERGELYKYEIEDADGALLPLKADPFAFRAEAPPGTASVVEGLSSYAWGDRTWLAHRAARQRHDAPLSIYEVHLGSFRRRADGGFLSYLELADALVPYVVDLGFTHVELLPVMEHPFYGSWGYQPLGLFAPTARFGSPDDFRALVDRFHEAGIGVILDWAPAHFPDDPHGLARFDGTCLFEHADPRLGRHPDWGTLVYDYDRAEVRSILISSALYWLRELHADGLRVDAVASMLYLDYSREPGEWVPNRHGGRENLGAIELLRELNEAVQAEVPGALMIAEESTAWPMVTGDVGRGGLGFDFKWNMGWMHDTLRYLGRDPVHRAQHHDEITFSMVYHRSERYILALSHDEVVHEKRSLLSRMPGGHEAKLANLRLLFAHQWAHGGKKLLFMGGELGQVREWSHDSAIDEGLLASPGHRGLRDLVRDLNAFYVRERAMHVSDCDHPGFAWIDCSDRANSVLSIVRSGDEGDRPVLVVLNFAGRAFDGYRVGVPRGGRWNEALNTNAAAYGGSNEGNLGGVESEPAPMHGCQASIALHLPALSALFLTPD